jgi:CBS domain-containing protein
MTRRDAHLDALVRQLGVAYYQSLHGAASHADVTRAVAQVAEAAGEGVHATPPSGAGPASVRQTGRWQVGDVMSTSVVVVSEHARYRHIAELLDQHHLTAVPVVTEDRRVIGVVSEVDLLYKQERHEHTDKTPGWQRHPAARTKAEAQTAKGLMTSPAVTIGPDELLGAAARIMSAHRVRQLPVVADDGTIIGVVSRTDLLKPYLRPDEEIAAEATDLLTGTVLADPAAIRVTAHGGVLTLMGRLASQEQLDKALRLTECIDGVVSVINRLHAPPPENWPSAGYHIPVS